MKIRSMLLATVILAVSGAAQAHAHLKSATPADNSVLTSAPKEIVLQFSEPTRLTALTIQKDGDQEGRRIEALPKEPAAALNIPVAAPLAPGKYVINWRAVGDDNHVVSGALHFTIAPK